MHMFAKIFELDYGFRFTEARTDDIKANIKASNFLPRESVAICKRQIHEALIMMRCPEALKPVQNDASEILGVFCVDDRTHVTSSDSKMLFLFRADKGYFTKRNSLEGDFPVYDLCNAGAQHVCALCTLFSDVRSINWSLVVPARFEGFLAYKETEPKTS